MDLGLAVGHHIVDDDRSATLQGTANDASAFAVFLCFLAVEGNVDVDIVVPRQRYRCGDGDGYPLVCRSEQQLGQRRHGGDPGGVRGAEPVERGSVAQGPEIEEVGAVTPGLEHEVAESENVLA